MNEIEDKKIKGKNKVKRQLSIITVLLWIFLVTTMITIVLQDVKNNNALLSGSYTFILNLEPDWGATYSISKRASWEYCTFEDVPKMLGSEGKEFAGWATTPDGWDDEWEIYDEAITVGPAPLVTEKTVYPVFRDLDPDEDPDEDDKFILILDLNIDGQYTEYSMDKRVEQEYYTFENVPNPIREGYEFLGWSTTSNGRSDKEALRVGPAPTITEKRVYAVWREVPIQYSFILNYNLNNR